MKVLLNSPGYSYDVHSLIKAFYPNEDVEIIDSDGDARIVVEVSSGDIAKDAVASGTITCEYVDEDAKLCKKASYDNADRSLIKNELKLCIYELLTAVTGVTLPWGTLTGIRPTKLPMKMINEGKSDEAIYDFLRKEYRCSDEKIELATAIAHREHELLSSLNDGGYSLYIGIPFCPTTCLYCSFTSYPIVSWHKRTDEYIDVVKKELEYVKKQFEGKQPDTIYIGGGTPTTLTANQLDDLIKYIRSNFDMSNIKEFTVEAGRPDSITLDKLETLFDNGITRLSINPQTMNDKTLKIIGRQHTVSQIYDAYDMARRVGFDNINMDLILGLPGEGIDEVEYTFKKIKELSPDNLTVHSMAIKRAAGMQKFLEEHEEYISSNTTEMMELAMEATASMGMVPYYLYRQKNMSGNLENVGYAKDGKYGIYNILIMEEVQTIVACGAGTVTKRVYGDVGNGARIERCDNVKDVKLYMEKIDEMIERKRKLFAD